MFVHVCDHFLANVNFHMWFKGEILPVIVFGKRPQKMMPSFFSSDCCLIYSSSVQAFLYMGY